jgi:hypothetical protein
MRNLVIDITASVIHFLLSGVFLALALVGIGFNQYGREQAIQTPELVGIVSGVGIAVLAVMILVRRTWFFYSASFLFTLAACFTWMVLVAAMDMQWLLMGYIILFSPFIYFKYRAEHQKS